MINSKLLDDLAKTLTNAMPAGIREMQHDMEKNFRAVLQGFFARLDLVTREEFEVQSEVLARTRTLVEELDKQVAELEAKVLGKPARATKSSKKAPGPEAAAEEGDTPAK